MFRSSRTSEFVGLPLEEQKRRIHQGERLFHDQGLMPQAWVAPAHGMDRFTLEALRTVSTIRTISDSFARRAVRRRGFVWIPQQLWHPRVMGRGLWTICLHPNEMKQPEMEALDSFLALHRRSFADPREIPSRAVHYGPADIAFEALFLALLRIKRGLRRRKTR